MKIIINEDNLIDEEVEEFSEKVRAILIDKDNKILVANYGNVILLPGGKVDKGETIDVAITRELEEELGQTYDKNELDFFTTLDYYQKNYPKRDETFKNRLVKTHYFVGCYKSIDIKSQKLTEKEIKDNFKLELVSLENLEKMILCNQNNNPRNKYFQIELLTISDNFKDKSSNIYVKKLSKKINTLI